MKLGMLVGLLLALCFGPMALAQTPPVQMSPATAPQSQSVEKDYKLGVADKIRILVFNEPTLSGEFQVNSNGSIAFPLIGDVPAVGNTTSEVNTIITTRLADGFLREPRVSIDMLSFRPFYILGEVNKPGSYDFSTGLTVLNAVATAQGFTYRADKRRVFIKHAGDNSEARFNLDSSLQVNPGDTIRIGERYF